MPDLTDERLAAILASVGDHLVVPTGATGTAGDPPASTVSPPNGSADPAGGGGRGGRRSPLGRPVGSGTRAAAVGAGGSGRGRPRRMRRLRAAWVAGVVVLAAAAGAVAPVREAVAAWLGIGTTEVVRVGVGEGDPGDLPHLGDDLRPVDAAAAGDRLGAALPDTTATGLGPAPVLAAPPEGGVILAWDDGATTLWVRRAEPPAVSIGKLLTSDDRFERVDGLGEDAAIVDGPHVLTTPQRRLAAGTVLVWIDAGFEHRLESDLDRPRMVEIARAITPR
jgi:hypothetical protein